MNVRFDFRFARNAGDHEFLQTPRQELVKEFAKCHAGEKNVSGVSLYPVARAGKSGSEVFYLDLFLDGISFPERFVAKFQSRLMTQQEGKSARQAQVAKLCSKYFTFLHDREDLGLLVYDLATAQDHVEFRGFFLDPTNSDKNCAAGLRSIFQLVGRHPNSDAPPKQMLADYDWYLQRKTQPLQRVRALAKSGGAYPSFREIGTSILSHFERMETRLHVDIYPYLVHGDLHARNLMLSRSNPARSELIDFGWVHYGHPAKDFVLMEATLKYMLLPEYLPVARGLAPEPLYPTAAAVEGFEQFLWSRGLELPKCSELTRQFIEPAGLPGHQARAFLRAYRCVQQVRESARAVLSSYCREHPVAGFDESDHYFASSFLMTLGLIGIQELDQFWALIGLDVLGHHL